MLIWIIMTIIGHGEGGGAGVGGGGEGRGFGERFLTMDTHWIKLQRNQNWSWNHSRQTCDVGRVGRKSRSSDKSSSPDNKASCSFCTGAWKKPQQWLFWLCTHSTVAAMWKLSTADRQKHITAETHAEAYLLPVTHGDNHNDNHNMNIISQC